MKARMNYKEVDSGALICLKCTNLSEDLRIHTAIPKSAVISVECIYCASTGIIPIPYGELE